MLNELDNVATEAISNIKLSSQLERDWTHFVPFSLEARTMVEEDCSTRTNPNRDTCRVQDSGAPGGDRPRLREEIWRHSVMV